MISKSRFATMLSNPLNVVITFVATAIVSRCVEPIEQKVFAESQPPATAPQSDTLARSDFPFVVKFEQGATKFLNGDSITIAEVRGTSEAFTSGELYLIKGTYKLASHEKAVLAAYVTATNSHDGIEKTLKVQQTPINRGEGHFTLYLPMASSGLPHVSFYSTDDGEGFGGNYFGTGRSVLREWWGSSKSNDKSNANVAATNAERRKPENNTPKNPVRTKDDFFPELFPHVVQFELGRSSFEHGNQISIQEVRGTAETITPGNFYMIKGTYVLGSHDHASLAAYTTAAERRNGTSESLDIQSIKVKRGEGTFTLILPMWCTGWPHIACYADGKNVADVYYGTGESVLKK